MAPGYPGAGHRNGYSLALTAAESRDPSALPAAIAVAAFITWPICRMLGPFTDLLGHLRDRGVGHVGQFGVGERGWQVFVDDPRFGVFVGGQLTASVLGVDLGRLTALLGLLGSTLITSSSDSSRGSAPATSSFWIAASSIRSVAVRNLSCDFIDAVRSARNRSLSSAMRQTVRRGVSSVADHEPRVDGDRHLDVLGHESDLSTAARRRGTQVGGALTALRIQLNAEHSGIGDRSGPDLAEPERIGILLRAARRHPARPGYGPP